jgi:glucosamine-6-phosphate deaminase
MTTLDKASRNGMAIHVSESRSEMGARAASDIAHEIRSRLQKQPGPRMIFAAAPSQSEMLSAPCGEKDIDWSRVTAFHMDEYLGLPAGAPQRFSCWLRKAIFDRLPFAAVHLLEPGDNPAQTASEYAAKLNAAPIDIVCCGIGSSGHLAFNDPPADFNDPLTVKIVHLDAKCRQQQVDDQCFATLNDGPLARSPLLYRGCSPDMRFFAPCLAPSRKKLSAAPSWNRSLPCVRPARCVFTHAADFISTLTRPAKHKLDKTLGLVA